MSHLKWGVPGKRGPKEDILKSGVNNDSLAGFFFFGRTKKNIYIYILYI